VRLGIIATDLAVKTALILAPNLEVVSPTLDWARLAVIPDEFFLIVGGAPALHPTPR
jgi:hypothetical protein